MTEPDATPWSGAPDRTATSRATGRLFVLTGPSAAGKTSLMRALGATGFPITRVATWATRARRADETDGLDYTFVASEAFEAAVQRGGMAEWARVYGTYKGLPWQVLWDALRQGRDAILALDLQGVATVRAKLPAAVVIFVLPPAVDLLARRLRGRAGGEPAAGDAARRLAAAPGELAQADAGDYVIPNLDGHLATAVADLRAIITAERRRTRPRLVQVWREATAPAGGQWRACATARFDAVALLPATRQSLTGRAHILTVGPVSQGEPR